jgi:hypothetical protein
MSLRMKLLSHRSAFVNLSRRPRATCVKSAGLLASLKNFMDGQKSRSAGMTRDDLSDLPTDHKDEPLPEHSRARGRSRGRGSIGGRRGRGRAARERSRTPPMIRRRCGNYCGRWANAGYGTCCKACDEGCHTSSCNARYEAIPDDDGSDAVPGVPVQPGQDPTSRPLQQDLPADVPLHPLLEQHRTSYADGQEPSPDSRVHHGRRLRFARLSTKSQGFGL